MDEISKIWPEWHIVDTIGKGAFGSVYKIKKEDFGKSYYAAVKVICYPQDESEINELESAGMDENSIQNYFEENLRGLISEIQVMESLKTAGNIVSIEDYKLVEKTGEFGWILYIRMELLKSLDVYLKEKGSLSEDETVKIGIDICSALECCEQNHTIHRDIKSANIFVNPYGDFKLGDFGISKQMESTMSVKSQKGTFMYMAPEIYRGESYDKTVDIYALGITLYRLLNNNRFPFMPPVPQNIRPGDADRAMTDRISGKEMPDPANCDAELARIVKKACAFQAGERYAHAADMKRDLKKWEIKKMYESMDEETVRGSIPKVEVEKPELTWRESEKSATAGVKMQASQKFTETEEEATYAAFNREMSMEKEKIKKEVHTAKIENTDGMQANIPKKATLKRIKQTRHIPLTQPEEIESEKLLTGTTIEMVVDSKRYWVPVKKGTKDGDVITVPLYEEDGYLDVIIRLDIPRQEDKNKVPQIENVKKVERKSLQKENTSTGFRKFVLVCVICVVMISGWKMKNEKASASWQKVYDKLMDTMSESDYDFSNITFDGYTSYLLKQGFVFQNQDRTQFLKEIVEADVSKDGKTQYYRAYAEEDLQDIENSTRIGRIYCDRYNGDELEFNVGFAWRADEYTKAYSKAFPLISDYEDFDEFCKKLGITNNLLKSLKVDEKGTARYLDECMCIERTSNEGDECIRFTFYNNELGEQNFIEVKYSEIVSEFMIKIGYEKKNRLEEERAWQAVYEKLITALEESDYDFSNRTFESYADFLKKQGFIVEEYNEGQGTGILEESQIQENMKYFAYPEIDYQKSSGKISEFGKVELSYTSPDDSESYSLNWNTEIYTEEYAKACPLLDDYKNFSDFCKRFDITKEMLENSGIAEDYDDYRTMHYDGENVFVYVWDEISNDGTNYRSISFDFKSGKWKGTSIIVHFPREEYFQIDIIKGMF